MNNGTGGDNTAVGAFALEDNASGNFNVAVGNQALQNSTASQSNTALGAFTLTLNTTGMNNTASGYNALSGNQAGSFNVADGAGALLNNNGDSNTAVGADALFNNGSGTNNIAIGQNAAINVTGTNSNIHIGNVGSSADNATIKIGTQGTQTSFFAAGIRGVMTGANNGVPVIIDGNGQLGTVNSSRRFKEDIQDMGDSSRALMQLRPVTFRYKQPYADGSKPIQYGLIAEEVAEVYPGLVAHSADGQIESVKYQVLDSMLLNELQRQQAKIAAQEELIQKLLDRVSKLESARSESQDR